ncbi:glycosyltransferase family 2 protein [Pelagibacterales bacterium SAG-MED05]|nr:glycosyltransferase family 2 protein [Pelagibacterales bacterium SAG-MED05]
MLISICIPTYNRPSTLINCLNSLSLQTEKQFEVCISDNCSKANIQKLIHPFKKKLKIRFNKNKKNLGFALNLLKVSNMAKGDFIWFLGDDDLIVRDGIKTLKNIIKKNKKCEFFWINSYYLNKNYLKKFNYPFNTKNLPKKMKRHSPQKKNKKLKFFDLIDRKISFDYLLGVFVCVFRRDQWNRHQNVIDKKLIKDVRTWSNFENTCFFIKIFCAAFSKSDAFFCARPLTVSLHGVREWSNLYPMVEIVRIPEALDYYRSKGLSLFKYIKNKNYALRNFFNYFFKIFFYGEQMGLNYINFRRHFFNNLIFPNAWLSIIYFINRKIRLFLKI